MATVFAGCACVGLRGSAWVWLGVAARLARSGWAWQHRSGRSGWDWQGWSGSGWAGLSLRLLWGSTQEVQTAQLFNLQALLHLPATLGSVQIMRSVQW